MIGIGNCLCLDKKADINVIITNTLLDKNVNVSIFLKIIVMKTSGPSTDDV